MKAIGLFEFGGPEVLQPIELPDPHAEPGEVRVRVHAVAVNPADAVFRAGDIAHYLQDQSRPLRPGMEAAGIVDEIGMGTETDLAIGDRVIALVNPLASGSYAQYAVVPAARVIRAPPNTTHAQAATLMMTGLSALHGVDTLGLPAGATVAITGAAGVVGGHALALAKSKGYRVIADASPADTELVRALGADIVVERGGDVADRILAVSPGGVDGLLDIAILGYSVLRAVRDGGSLILFRSVGERGMPTAVTDKRLTVCTASVMAYFDVRQKLEEIVGLAEKGVLKCRVARVFPADEAAEAHRLLEAGGVRGRMILEF
ncbi:NADP-dependent oxidoreductase [Streptomyces chartreusis]|uniref:NADP-dependent oxidoreductase n=1 Tax=Streptomyces chartreusis TaxID=1969 RepID=UPI003684F741